MVDRDNNSVLARAAARAEGDPFFLAAALAAYRADAELDNAALAAELGCAESALPRLSLCRWPRGDSPMFREDVNRIAAYTGVNAARLARLLRAVDAASALRAAPPAPLLAAQDRGISEMRAPYEPDPPPNVPSDPLAPDEPASDAPASPDEPT